MSSPTLKFTHLHTHSHYSLLDGLAKIDELVKKAKDCGMEALALTDHGVMYGAIEFYQKCKKAGIKPIIGVEFYTAPNGRLNKRPKIDDERHHLILLAKNEQGYKNLLKLTSLAHLEGFYYKPRVDLELLEKYNEGLIALTACLQGEIPKLITAGKFERAKETAEQYLKIYGENNFYLEAQYHPNLPEQKIANEGIYEISKLLGIPCVATNDIHYLEANDDEAQDILLCLQTKKKLEDKDRLTMMGEDFSFRTSEQMIEGFSDRLEAIEKTQKIVELCNLEIELGKIKLPHYEVPEGKTAEEYLEEMCYDGVRKRYGFEVEETEKLKNNNQDTRNNNQINSKFQNSNKQDPSDQPAPSGIERLPVANDNSRDQLIVNDKIDPKIVKERLDYELSVIEKTGFATYLLIVQDFVNWAKDNKIVVGPGRGSAAGSLAAYLLNITNIDPLKYDLLFERFLNPERISMPDIDMDFADTRRDEVIDYVAEKYGRDHVSQIITFGTMAARAAVRDVGRVLGMSYGYCDGIAKMIAGFKNLDEAIEKNLELKAIYETDLEAKKLLLTAKKLEGVARHASTHACGLVITKEALDNYVPLQYDSASDGKKIVSQYSMKPIDDLGLLKMDFLGLKNLTIMEKALRQIKYNYGDEIDLDNIPLDDDKTFKLLRAADTTGVFQLESAGMKRYLKQLQPTDLEDIIAMVALYRPGPMEWIPDYIEGKHGRKKPTYLHPILAPILEKTHGVAIYQEQLLKIARDLAGFTLGEADILRKAVGKKIKELLAEQKQKFVDGCVKNGVSQGVAMKVFAFIEPFAGYGFNRSHAACYAMIAYQTAYLKANFPAEFMASLLTSDQHDTDRIAIEVEECRQMGIEILPPDINESYKRFTVIYHTNNALRRGSGQADEDANFAPPFAEASGGKNTQINDEKEAIRFGLLAIKNVGEHVVEEIVQERQDNGHYQNLEDFLRRVRDKDLNKKSLESLIKAGALDRFGERNQLLYNLEILLNFHKNLQKERNNNQVNLFSALPKTEALALSLRETSAIDERTKLSWEKELLGLYISEHPFREFESELKEITKRTNGLTSEEIKQAATVKIGGVITNIKKIITRSNEPMLFVKIEDTAGTIEVLVFPKTLKETEEIWQEEKAVVICGRLSDKDGTAKLICSKVWKLETEDLEKKADEIRKYNEAYYGNGKQNNQTTERIYVNFSKNNSSGINSADGSATQYNSSRDGLEQARLATNNMNRPAGEINLAANGDGTLKRVEIRVPGGLTQEGSAALKSLIKEREGGDFKVSFSFPSQQTGMAKKIMTNSRIKLDEETKKNLEQITGMGSVAVFG